MKPLNAFVAWPVEFLRELRTLQRERIAIERREQRIAERAAAKAERQEARRIARQASKSDEPEQDEIDDDVVEAEIEVTAKPLLDAASSRVKSRIDDHVDAPWFELLEKRDATIEGKRYRLQSLYFTNVEELGELVEAGAVVLGVWSTVTGEPVVEQHRRIMKFMPPRLVSIKKGQEPPPSATLVHDGDNTQIYEIDDDAPQQIFLISGQAERRYG